MDLLVNTDLWYITKNGLFYNIFMSLYLLEICSYLPTMIYCLIKELWDFLYLNNIYLIKYSNTIIITAFNGLLHWNHKWIISQSIIFGIPGIVINIIYLLYICMLILFIFPYIEISDRSIINLFPYNFHFHISYHIYLFFMWIQKCL